jgi:hypothetical protein
MPYIPGKALILSRLPALEWFTLDQAAEASGWSRSYIRQRIRQGDLPAQAYQKKTTHGGRTYLSYRIHVDDLCIFIMQNNSGRFSEEKPFRDIVTIVRGWPKWMIRELHTAIGRLLQTQ